LENHLVAALAVLEFVLSVVFLLASHATGNMYFRGVGVGLVIAWVTSTIAYLFKRVIVGP
jgi:hypothetical protein